MFRVSQSRYRYESKTNAENEQIAQWLIRLPEPPRILRRLHLLKSRSLLKIRGGSSRDQQHHLLNKNPSQPMRGGA
jgi:hypothetical protein